MKKPLILLLKIVIFLFALAVAFTAYLAVDLKHYAKSSPNETGHPVKPRILTIVPGDPFHRVTQKLADMGVIRSPLKFRILALFGKYDRRIKTGEYRLAATMSPEEILKKLVKGDVILYRFTVPEGYTLKQIAGVVAKAGLVDARDFLNTAREPRFIRTMKIEAGSLEGYLFPDTYHFPKPISSQAIIHKMVRRLNEVVSNTWRIKARQLGFTLHEVLTLASIIEKETGAAHERPLIASVFHNRLKKKMRLESDPTVIYGVPDFDGNLTRKHLQTPTPYNTYLIPGLPPGPIASPGAEAIRAVLYPQQSKYLFFVSKKDGTHHFTTRFSDHQRAVRKYQLGK